MFGIVVLYLPFIFGNGMTAVSKGFASLSFISTLGFAIEALYKSEEAGVGTDFGNMHEVSILRTSQVSTRKNAVLLFIRNF